MTEFISTNPKYAKIQVDYLDHMGEDLTVVNAARVSHNKRHETLEKNDPGLIRFLANHDHFTTFTHCFVSFRLKIPIFVARQLVKHQVGLSLNEVSRRYVDEDPEFYMPDSWRKRAPNVKQGSLLEPVNSEKLVFELFENHTHHCLNLYRRYLALNVCPEQARMVLPLHTMTEWIWSGSLAAFARVCNLRLDPHAQYETAIAAKQIKQWLEEFFPISVQELIKTGE